MLLIVMFMCMDNVFESVVTWHRWWYHLDHISLNIYISSSSGSLPCRQEWRLGPASRRVAWAQPSEDGMIHFTDSMALRIRQVSATGNCLFVRPDTVSPATWSTWSDHDKISTASTRPTTPLHMQMWLKDDTLRVKTRTISQLWLCWGSRVINGFMYYGGNCPSG